mgnify:CR=1 FL=1|jgi:nitrous oxide reductase accessory protein NosL
MNEHDQRATTRRALLGATAAAGVASVGGCLGFLGGEEAPDPATIEAGTACDQCNMIIDRHPGPVGQSYYVDDAPGELEDREDGRANFCSTWCMYSYTLNQEQRGFEATGSYSTDYSAVDYDIGEDAGTLVIDPSPHLDADAFAPVSELTYVVDSDVEGAMGSSLVGFSDGDDASAFADEYGGELVEHGEISYELISALSS